MEGIAKTVTASLCVIDLLANVMLTANTDGTKMQTTYVKYHYVQHKAIMAITVINSATALDTVILEMLTVMGHVLITGLVTIVKLVPRFRLVLIVRLMFVLMDFMATSATLIVIVLLIVILIVDIVMGHVTQVLLGMTAKTVHHTGAVMIVKNILVLKEDLVSAVRMTAIVMDGVII